MKARSDPTTPLSIKLERASAMIIKSEEMHDSHETTYEVANDYEEIEIHQEYQDSPEGTPSIKRRRKGTITRNSEMMPQSQTQTIEYIFNNDMEDTNEISTNAIEQETVEVPQNYQSQRVHDPLKRKSKAFGKYVGTLMRDLTDEKVFFDAQSEILKILEDSLLKMHNFKKT
jgi:hypothetical protein